jgi:DNA repair exonuclease SbcCD nuclease subunit
LDGRIRCRLRVGSNRFCQQRKISIVFIVGDLFDADFVNPQERDTLLEVLQEFDRANIVVIMLAGNHDRFQQNYTNLHFFGKLVGSGFRNLHVALNDTEVFTVAGQKFVCVPGFFQGNLSEHLAEWDAKHPGAVFGIHELIKGQLADNGHKLRSGLQLRLPTRYKYMAGGDLHTLQPFGPRAMYCGSQVQHDFGESLPKGFIVVDPQSGSITRHKLAQPNPLITVESAVALRKAAQEQPGALLRFRLVGENVRDLLAADHELIFKFVDGQTKDPETFVNQPDLQLDMTDSAMSVDPVEIVEALIAENTQEGELRQTVLAELHGLLARMPKQ